MPYLLLALIGATLIFWLVLKLKEADQKVLHKSFRITLFLILSLAVVYAALTGRIGIVAASALGLIILFAPKIRRYFAERSTKKYLPRDMTSSEAAQILNIQEDASESEIQKAYHQLIAKNHPDHGGSKYIAQQLNQARDLLIKKIQQKN